MSGFGDQIFNRSVADNILSDIIEKVLSCCKLMVEDYIDRDEVIVNNEEVIRNVLRENYLNDNEVRAKVGLEKFYFIAEAPVTYIDDVSKRRADLKVISNHTLDNTKEYFIFECKRIDGTRALNKVYLQEGIERFVDESKPLYPSPMKRNCMFGFVVKKIKVQKNIEKINELQGEINGEINEENLLMPINIIESFPFIYQSSYDMKKSELKLYHLFYDFSEVINK